MCLSTFLAYIYDHNLNHLSSKFVHCVNIVDCKIKQRNLIGNKGEIARNTSKSQTKKIKINVVDRYLGIV